MEGIQLRTQCKVVQDRRVYLRDHHPVLLAIPRQDTLHLDSHHRLASALPLGLHHRLVLAHRLECRHLLAFKCIKVADRST